MLAPGPGLRAIVAKEVGSGSQTQHRVWQAIDSLLLPFNPQSGTKQLRAALVPADLPVESRGAGLLSESVETVCACGL